MVYEIGRQGFVIEAHSLIDCREGASYKKSNYAGDRRRHNDAEPLSMQKLGQLLQPELVDVTAAHVYHERLQLERK